MRKDKKPPADKYACKDCKMKFPTASHARTHAVQKDHAVEMI